MRAIFPGKRAASARGGQRLGLDGTRVCLALARLAVGCLAVAVPACDESVAPENEPPRCDAAYSHCRESLDVGGGTNLLRVYRSHALDRRHPGVRRGVVVVHGTDRNADDYFDRMMNAVLLAGVEDETVVVSPRFTTEDDVPAADEPRWSSSGWKRGNLSRPSGPEPRVSSYAALDRILEVLGDTAHFPDLTALIVTGHSAGGQVAHRYAATAGAEATLGLPVRYVVANPSTYLFLREERPSGDDFAIPDTLACPDWNDWHYGLSDMNAFASAVGVDAIRANLASRDVVVLLGTADTLTSNLDVTCGANLQGSRRLYRGTNLVSFMDRFFPGHSHRRVLVEGVGHSSTDMYGSSAGRAVLFGP